MKLVNFFRIPRNLAALLLCAACLAVNAAGMIYGGVRHANGAVDGAGMAYILQQGCAGCVTIFLVYAAEWLLRIRLPAPVELSLSLFAFAGNTVAGVYGVYGLFPLWDKILHTFAGALFAAVGYAVAFTFFREKFTHTQAVLLSALIALLAALAEGYVWEMFEFVVDTVNPASNAQRWKDGLLEVLPDGTYLTDSRRGSALIDTMLDMIVNFTGALLFSAVAALLFWKKPAASERFCVRRLAPHKKRADRSADDRDERDDRS